MLITFNVWAEVFHVGSLPQAEYVEGGGKDRIQIINEKL